MMSKENENIFVGVLPQLITVFVATLAAISDGMLYGWTAPVLPILLGPDSPVKITETQGEWLENFMMIGCVCGLTVTIYLVDKMGRKGSQLLSCFVMLLVWIVKAVATRVEYLYVARVFAGAAGNMAFVATPMYIAEIADQKIRGFLSSMIYLMMLVGIVLIYGVAPYVPIYAHCIIGGALNVLQLIIFPFMPESPYQLVGEGKIDKARNSLQRLRPKDADIEREINEITAAIDRQKSEKGRPQDLVLISSNRKAMIIMGVLNIAQHFSSISVMVMNLHLILEAAGSIYMDTSAAGIVFSLLMLVAATIASFTIDKYGRKILLITSSILTGFCLLLLAIYFSFKKAGYDVDTVSWIPIVSVMLYALFFKLGLGMVPIVLTAELFPAKVKALGMTLADGFYVVASLLSLIVYHTLTNYYGIQYPFYLFSITCFLSAIFTHFFIPETKGKTLEEIQLILKGNKIEPENPTIKL